MKLLCLVTALDLKFRYSRTAATWQLLKGLYEVGHDVIAVPYQGAAIASPWWRVEENPCLYESIAYSKARHMLGPGTVSNQEGLIGQLSKRVIEGWVRPRWEACIAQVLHRERSVDAVIVFGIPVQHIAGLPEHLTENGRAYLVVSSLQDMGRIERELHVHGLASRNMGSSKFAFETISVLELRRPPREIPANGIGAV